MMESRLKILWFPNEPRLGFGFPRPVPENLDPRVADQVERIIDRAARKAARNARK